MTSSEFREVREAPMSQPDEVPLGRSQGSVEDGDHLDDGFSIYADAPGEDRSRGDDDEVPGVDEELLP
jgi:hypothetical protein